MIKVSEYYLISQLENFIACNHEEFYLIGFYLLLTCLVWTTIDCSHDCCMFLINDYAWSSCAFNTRIFTVVVPHQIRIYTHWKWHDDKRILFRLLEWLNHRIGFFFKYSRMKSVGKRENQQEFLGKTNGFRDSNSSNQVFLISHERLKLSVIRRN